jgi:hypothetical protein
MGTSRVRVLRARLSCKPVIFVFSLIAISVVLLSCAKHPRPVIGPGAIAPSISKATYDAYRKGGWVPLVEPDSRFVLARSSKPRKILHRAGSLRSKLAASPKKC